MHNIDRFSDSITRLIMGLCVSFDVSPNDFFSSSTRVIELVETIFEEAQVKEDRFINCIKAVRTCLGTGLVESKKIVEKFTTRIPQVSYVKMVDLGDWCRYNKYGEELELEELINDLRNTYQKGDKKVVDLDNLKDYVVGLLIY